jgi:hypothetical protein
MVMSRLSTTLSLAVALFAPIALGAAEGREQSATAPPIINTVCTMDGKEMDLAKAPTVPITIGEGAEAKQFRLAMCSDACCTEFKKDPAAALKPRFGKGAPGPKTSFK